MKYWCTSEIEHKKYYDSNRQIPKNHPAAIIKDDDHYIEVEIIPGTSATRAYICPDTFQHKTALCVELERRIWRGNSGMFVEIFYVPLKSLGYDKEPVSGSLAYNRAMQGI